MDKKMKNSTDKESVVQTPEQVVIQPSCDHVLIGISAITEQLKGVAKNGQNKQQNFKYRAAADIMEALSPLLAKERIIIIPRVKEVTTTRESSGEKTPVVINTAYIEFSIISSIDGSSLVIPIWAQAYDYSDKGLYKCYTFAWKNMVQIVFAITIEADPDSDDIQSPHKPQPEDRSGKVIEQLVAMAGKYKIPVKTLALELGAVSSDPKTLTCLSLQAIEDTAKNLASANK